MRKFKNTVTGLIVTEGEYLNIIKSEFSDMWDDNAHTLVDEFIADGRSKDDFVADMVENDYDTDFIEIEE